MGSSGSGVGSGSASGSARSGSAAAAAERSGFRGAAYLRTADRVLTCDAIDASRATALACATLRIP
jgi:hypothetical protein